MIYEVNTSFISYAKVDLSALTASLICKFSVHQSRMGSNMRRVRSSGASMDTQNKI